MNRGDLRTAAECIQQFHQMEHVEGDDYEALADAEAALRERVREIVISATEAGDDATTTCWLPLLHRRIVPCCQHSLAARSRWMRRAAVHRLSSGDEKRAKRSAGAKNPGLRWLCV